ncbi:MAG: MFS transporter [Phenylobacterium sp.]|nr:MFS transporter [Phenylobacterium sp.]MCW5758189.1 MFS transporter [Phenylobacterium sp.]
MLGLLTAANALNMLDRRIINILAEPIKHELNLSDAQLGALTGLAFALLYCTAALPIARIADRSDRVRVLGVAAFAWSAFTALSGAAGSFIQMFLCRIGVGVGEAGCAPPAQSLIVDEFPAERRSGALAIFMSGQSIGGALGLVAGGVLGEMIGWRWTLVCAGVPGLIVGALVLLTLTDPRRHQAPADRPAQQPLMQVLGMLLKRPSFVLVSLAFGSIGFVGYTAGAFAGSFYLRSHAADLAQLSASLGMRPLAVIGLGLGLFGAVGGAAGSLAGGWLGDRMGRRDVRALTLIPAAGMLLGTISYAAMFTVPDVTLSLVLSALAAFFIALFGGPGSLALQQVAGANARATALAVTTFIASGIGLGIGPVATGLVSDALAPSLGPAEGLRMAILICLVTGLLGAICFAAAGRTLARDIAEANDPAK